ncbi:MAG: ion transporter [Actinobacteria bacterium]|nr:ion transporter [Actinomycetota bacterium]
MRPVRSESEFEVWLEEVTERADPFMSWLGLVFALLVGYELAVELAPRVAAVVTVAGWAIWGVFFLEFVAKLWVAPNRTRFVRRHWLQALMLVVPTLRILRFLRLLRLGRALPAARVVSSSYRTAGTARKLLRSRLGYLGAISVVVVIALAELVYLFEDGRADTFASFGDALLWSATVVLALQGDPVPATAVARIAMLLGFAFGLVIVATLAGTVGAFLVDERRERATAEEEVGGRPPPPARLEP